jgi:hypothetical protein
MSKKIILLILTLTVFFAGFSQKSVNDYKYVVVPNKFDFFEQENKYQINELLEFLFNKYGYEAFLDNEVLPNDLNSNRCLVMYANAKNIKSMFTTKIVIELKDCNGNLIVASDIGKTRVKEFNKAYTAAIRDAFKSIRALNYKYISSGNTSNDIENEEIQVLSSITKDYNSEKANTEVKLLKKEIEDLKKQKEMSMEMSKKLEKASNPKADLWEIEKSKEANPSESLHVLYAQRIDGGFQLVNAEPRVVMILLKTSAPNVYAVKDKNAIVYKQNDKWMYSENNGVNKNEKELNIKF